MDTRITQLKSDFNNIVAIRSTVKGIFDTLKQRIDKLKQLYSDFIQHNDNQLFVFGLDSFRFQSKLIDIEYDDMMRLFLAINNRMYCEYFKLYKIIIAYIHETIEDKKIIEIIKVTNFPVYKDLEPYKEYKFETVLELHENILILLGSIMNSIENKENELEMYQKKRRIGLNIDNFVTSFNYDIIIMRERVAVFLTYIEFFHILHTKYLKRFSNKIQLMYTHINHDIKFDESVEMNREKKKELLDEIGDVDDDLLNSLKMSDLSDGSRTPTIEMSNTFVDFCVDNKIDVNDSVYTEFGKVDTHCEELLNNSIQQHLHNIESSTPTSKFKGLVKKIITGNSVSDKFVPVVEEPSLSTESIPVDKSIPVDNSIPIDNSIPADESISATEEPLEEWITPGKKKQKHKRSSFFK